jgi:N12 class adenine-specific DNA methylase
MPRKIDLITQMYEEKVQSLSDSPGNWLAFLHTAANNYKYDFSDQVLITAQRPHATACAPIELWNSRFDRWVNKGAHGIALIDDKSGHLSLHYIFDVSDTNCRYGNTVSLWKMNSRYDGDIVEALEARFGELANNSTVENAIISAADNAVSDNITDYLSDLISVRENSFLEDFDELNTEVMFRNLLKNSVSYMMMVRCGMDTDAFFDIDDFREVLNFNSLESITRLGAATSDIAEMGLREIEQTVIALLTQEKKQNRTFETVPEKVYHEATEKVKERTDDNHDSNLQNTGRFSDPGTEPAGAATGNAGQVRNASSGVSDEPQKGTVSEPESIGQADRAFDGNRADGAYSDRSSDDTNEENRGRDGELESNRPAPLGGTDEQHQALGGGNGTERPDLQLNLPSVTQQQQNIEAKAEADNNASAFTISQEDIDAILTRGGIVSGGKFRIYEQFLKKESSAENAKMLKEEYGIGGSYPAVHDRDLDENHDSKGLEISRGTIGNPDAKVLLPWTKVEKRIGELIAADRFFSPKDKEEYPKYRKEKEARAERKKISDAFKSVVDDFNDYETQLGNEAVVLNQYYMISAAGAFYSGEKKYHSRTADGDFALPTMRQALQEIKEQNTHLTGRADEILAELSTAIALPLEPSYDELNPPPEPEKEYRFSLGDTVYLGTSEYEILSYDDNEVRLFDEAFPIFNKVIPRAEFNEKLRENPLNDKYAFVIDDLPEVPDYAPKANYDDAFFVDQERGEVVWMYYNPDATAGGQYVTNTLTFDEIKDVGNEYDNADEFFEALAEIADQYLSDVGTPWFDESSEQFKENPTFTECDEVTMLGLLEATQAEKLTPWEEYSKIKERNPDCIVLYQVGDFFEIMGVDADSVSPDLGLTLGNRSVGLDKQVPMIGFPAKILDENTEKLRSIGFDVLIAPLENGKRNEYIFKSTKEPEQTVETNIGNVPIEDYREIIASQNGFDSYEDMYNQGVRLGDGYDKDPEPVKPAWEQKPKAHTKSFDLHPDVPQAQRHNFDLASNEMETVGKKERFRRNIMAIQLLKKCEDENRYATPDEQIILSQYVGWGGIAEAFDENNSAWATEYLELKAVLDFDEYAAARESTLTAFYTPPVVIRNMYKALENMSFQTGNILEPSCGVGNFLGMLPDSMKSSKLYGIELDSISGRIAQQLYQKSSIAVQGFEKTDLPDSFFDCAIGNVPFGQFKVPDKRYDKNNFLIHDYFFARTLDKVRPGGIIAFVTSKGTLDKENPAVRKYIAQRADLLGAIRLPNDTFKGDAGTEVTSDIIFLQKRDRMVDTLPDWVHLNTDENGIRMNQYFIDHPDMIMGEMKMLSGQFGPEAACVPYDGANLDEQLNEAIQNIHAEITDYEIEAPSEDEEDLSVPADPNVRNFSFTVEDGKIYYRENSRMKPVDVSKTAESRIKGLIAIRDCVRNLIEYQTEDYSDEVIRREQDKLNELYDDFEKKYGLINSRGNSTAFSEDSSYCLLCSLEVLDDEGNFIRKADMFSKRTIKQKTVIQSVDTASEALAVSLAEKVKIDMPFMCELTGKTEEELFEDLKGVIFLNPHYDNFQTHKYLIADEYLSGNVREKLSFVKKLYDTFPETDYSENIKALEAVQPKDLTASEIAVRLGATWLPPEIVEDFIFDVFQTPRYSQWNIHVRFSQITGEWNIEGKSIDRGNIKAYNTYGTDRINGYKIIEETLNLRDVRIFDYIEDENGNRKPVLNKKETAIAQGKQELLKQAFGDWIWSESERRERLCRLYNDRFNSNRVREYDGSHLNFVGINPEITLRKHQVDAIARILYGGNTLLAHVVGAGKTFEMVAAAQESKRLGLCQKSLFVVPNHLTEQWASEYLQLYPSANILVATKKDFETKNRKKFCGRIATGDYDAVIIGHTQFEKIPMSVERQQRLIQQQMDELVEGIAEAKRQTGNNFTVKQLEKTRKTLQQKLDKLNDQSRKDDVVTFEELGVDRIFIDEAHYYKNLAAFSKMRNVGGISQTEAQKSSDLYIKCRYLDEITGGKGVVFATGTPISNSMVELYTMQKYLQYNTLKKNGLLHFDSWASTFGETVTAIELAPEGTGYRAKTRFARFYNLPELMMMFREVADVQTADMLKLPVPEAHYHNVVLKPTEMQKEMVADLSDRAERVRNRMVDSSVDNMLLITNDGRKLALDQRLMNDMLPDDESSKCTACADNAFEIWQKSSDNRGTQMIFCDLSTPHNDGKFNVYDDIRDKLIAKGVPPEEIAYIHTANSEAQKKEMFGKVRSGQIRILLGSTQKMGAGTNVQKKLVALSHLDCPWRPSDLQQREGRIIRQGNDNPEVDIYTFVTENTFDSYLYQLVESKQKFIGQIMTSKSPVRSAEDVDEAALSYAEIKALATGNPHIKEKMDLDIDVSRLKLLKANHLSQKYALEDQIIKEFPQKINACEQRIQGLKADIEYLKTQTHPNEDGFSPMQIDGVTYTDKKEAGTKILEACKAKTQPEATMLGMYRGYTMELAFDTFSREYQIKLSFTLTYTVPLGTDIFGNIQRLDNLLDSLPDKLTAAKDVLENTNTQLANAKVEVEKPFPKEEELKSKTARLDELNILLSMDKRDNEIVDGEREDSDNDKEPQEQCAER